MEKMQNWVKGGREAVMWPTFRILELLHIPGATEPRNFKFGMHIDHKDVLSEDASSGHQCGFVDGLATLYYKSNMETDEILAFW